MKEYIFNMGDALYNMDTGEAVFKPKVVGEVVRCKDCKYWRDDHTCREHSLVSPMGANDFCSRGAKDGDSDDES